MFRRGVKGLGDAKIDERLQVVLFVAEDIKVEMQRSIA